MSLFPRPWGNYLLEDIVETQVPDSIAWWPQTIGWYLLLFVLFFFFVQKSFSAYRQYKRNAYRREAIKWLNQVSRERNKTLIKQLPTLLRQTALLAFSRTEVTELTGKKWEHWLDQQCHQTDFVNQCPNVLHQLAYADNIVISDAQLSILLKQISLWITCHRRYDD